MCGIAGIVSLDSKRTPPRAPLERMLNAIRHRGPDDEGIHIAPGVALGHRRLSILDLSPAGHQPMAHEAGHVLTYNGEIYNYVELRDALGLEAGQARGDTAVLVQALARWGEGALDRLNGMFAFGWWNARERSMLLVRDRFGIKPLYYAVTADALVFASELRAILASGLVDYEPDPQAVSDYLGLRFVPAPLTAVRGVFKLPPGSLLTLTGGRVQVRSWYRLPVAGMFEADPADAQERFEALFEDAVDLRLRADVPVGVFLSGGLDSSAVAAVASRAQPIDSFAVAFEKGGFYDERFYARQVARRLGTRHHELVVTAAQFRAELPEILGRLDEPITDLAALPLYFLAAEARRHVKVILSGEGSDEVLGGYDFNRIATRLRLIEEWQRIPKGLRDAGIAVTQGRIRALLTRLNAPTDRYPALRGQYIISIFTDAERRALLGPQASGLGDPRRYIDAAYADVAHADPFNQIMAVYSGSWLSEDLLMKADKMTMAHALELRVPFLDYRLVEHLFSLQGLTKVRGPATTGTKRMLRRAMRGRLPRSVLTRDKRGFPVPLAEWARDEVDWFADLFADRSGVGGLFERRAVDNLLTRQRRGEHVWQRAWNLAALYLWDRRMREQLPPVAESGREAA